MALSNSRKKQLEQAKKNAKEKAKQKQNKALIQQYNATHKNAPKQTVSAKTNNRSTQKQASTPRRNAKNPRADSNHGIQTARHTASTAKQASTYLSGGNSSRSRTSRYAASSGTTLPKTTRRTGTGKTWNEKEERQKAIDTLNANSMAWHNTSDEAEKTRLHAANNRIRQKFGMTYNGDSGATYLPKAGGGKTNVSKPVVETARNAAFGQNYQTQGQRQARYDELNNEIDRMQKQYPYLIAMDMKNRNAGEKLAAVPWLISHPKLAAAGINGDDQYNKMSTTNKKQADAMYQLYKRLNDEADAISKRSAGKAWGSGVANAALNAAGAVENGARYVTSAAENALSGALKLAGANDAGKFWEDVAKNTANTSFADSAMQKVNDWAQPVGSAKKAQELAGSGARMIPGIALNAATGGASKVSSLLSKAPVDGASMAMVFGDSAASGAREALQDGASLNRALAYGAGSGLTEVGTEKMFGGIPGLNEGAINTGGGVLGRALDILGEGVEEAASTLVNPYLKRATYDKNAQNATAQELWDSAKGGIALAGVMQGASGLAGRMANRRYGTAPAETTTSIHDANADMRAADAMYDRLHPETAQALPTAQRLALPDGNTRTANTMYAGEQGTAYNQRAFNQIRTPDVMYVDRNGGVSGEMNAFPNVFYASENGQVSDRLAPRMYLPEGRQTKTRFSDRVTGTETIPQYSVDEAGKPNGGLTGNEMQWAKLLQDSANKTGVSVQQYVDEIVGDTFDRYNEALQAAEQYVKDYKPQGVSVIRNEDGTGVRASNNEQWYSDFYSKNGRKPKKSEAAQIAAEMVNRDIRNGGGSWIGANLATDIKTALEIQRAGNTLGNDVLSAEIVGGNLVIQRGERGYTKDIRDTNAARNGIVSPAQQGTPQTPLNTGTGQGVSGAAQTQSAPTLADVRKAQNDIMPKLTRAGAEAAQTGVQTAPPEITQPMQENAQAAAQQADINPKLTKAEVNAESSVGAAETGFDTYSKMVNDYGAIPEGMNPARMVDVPQSTNGTDRVSNVARTIMESGVTPDSLIPALENHVAEGLFSHDVKSLKKTLSGATKTIQKKGWQGAFDQWEEVTDDRRAVTDDDIALGQMMYTAAVEAGDTQTAMKLAGDLAVQGTALGRGVNAFKLLKKTTPEGQLYYLQKAVQKIQQEYQSRFDKQANKAAKKQGVPAAEVADRYGLKLNEDLAKEFLQAETDEARAEITDKIYNDVAQQIPKTAGDMLNAWRYFAMLGNPRTHIRNIMGNVASAAALDTSHKVSAVGQKFLPQEKRTRALHTSKAAKQFAKADYANVEAELSGNAYKTEMSEIKQRQKLFPKPLQKVMDVNTWALDAEDQVFKKKSYIDSMGNFLTARGWDVNNLTEAQLNEARQHAIQDAKIATFQDASALADTLSRLEKKNKATEVIIGSLVPFKRTPINVAKRSFELSPVGLLKAITYDAVQVKKGNMDATKMIDHIGQGLTGSGVAALGAFLAAQGLFSAGSSDDDKEANFDAGMGQQEYAINIGGKSYTIDWASPAVVPLAMGGELYEALHQKYDDEETAFNQAMATVSRMFDPMLNMTMLSGIGSTVSSAAYNKSNPLFGIASNVATNFGGQFVPTLFGQVARTVDNTRRTTYADKNSPVPSSVQKFLQRQANKIPGLSQYQPAYTDVWGREQKNGPDNVFARAAYNFFSPGYLADAKGTQTEKALKELYQATGDNSVLPSKPQKYYKAEDGTKKFLTAQEYSTLTSQSGKISLDAIDKLTKSEAYKQMSNDERIEAVADIYKYAKAIAANKVYKKELDGTTKIVSESGIEPGLYYAYKEMEDSLNNDMEGWEARDQVFNAIKADSSLSDQEKNGLYHSLLIKGTSQSQWDKYTEISGKVTAEEYVDAMIQKQAITKEGEDIEKGRASLEATEFSYYLDSKGYTGEKRQALEDTFKFYSMVKADPANYTFDMIRENGGTKEKAAIGEVESAGISAAQYAQIKSAASGVTYEKGKSGAKLAAVAKVVSQNTANYNEYAAVMHALGYKKIDGHYSSGGKLPEESGLNTGINVNRSSASQKTSSAGFVNPTTASNSVVTSGYGGRNAVKTSKGYSSTNHDGIDIGGTGGNLNGQAADSIGGGKVTEVGYDENGYGNYVVVDHGDGYTSLYGHLQKATVKQGDTVSAGQQVGVIGSTGSSSAPHLHLRVHKNGQSIDPRTVIPGYGG
jgi:murein DD-endopeptidase MepM/ murein hydrolase activator NlpD